MGDELVVEWRALTVALLDEVAPRVRARLGSPTLPLACVLEGGTWAAGRALAAELRDGLPPLRSSATARSSEEQLDNEATAWINVHLIDHPLVQHKLTLMRKKEASTNSFRRLLNEIWTLMAYEVTRDLPMHEVEIETPLETMHRR